MRVFKNVALVLAVFLFISGTAFAQKSDYVTQGRKVSGVAAVVNGEMISWRDLQMQSSQQIAQAKIQRNDPNAKGKIEAIQRQVLDTIIMNTLLLQEAERLGVKVDEANVDAEIQRILDSNKITLEVLEGSLSSQGLSLSSLKDRIRNNLISARIMAIMVSQKVVVPQHEIEAYYNAHKDEFVKGKTVDLQIIIFSPALGDKVDDIIADIRSGKLSFSSAAKQYSAGPGAKDGGNLGTREWESLSVQSRVALQGVPVGGISDVFMVNDAKSITKLLAQKDGTPKSFAEAEKEVDALLKEPLMQKRFKDYTDSLREKAVIDVKI